MTESITNYEIYCNTETAFVPGWGTIAPAACYNNNAHSVDLAQINSLETIVNVNANSTSVVHKYQIYCLTESIYVKGWGNVEPTTCYNNTTHSVNLSSVQELETVNNSQVKIIEDGVNVSRNIKVIQIKFSQVAKNTTQDQYFTFNYITSMYSFNFVTDDTNKGDQVTIANNADTNLGLITSNVTALDTVINVPAVMFTFGSVGFSVTLDDGTNIDDLGEILSMDLIAGTITVETAAVNSFLSTNTFIKMTYYTMRDFIIGPSQVYSFGDDVIGGAAVPVGTTTKFSYTNNQTIAELDEPKDMNISLIVLFGGLA